MKARVALVAAALWACGPAHPGIFMQQGPTPGLVLEQVAPGIWELRREEGIRLVLDRHLAPALSLRLARSLAMPAAQSVTSNHTGEPHG